MIPSVKRILASVLVRQFPAYQASTDHGCFSGQVGKVLGERWKALSEKQRTPYEAKAKADKQRYEDEKASYNNVGFSLFVPLASKLTNP